MAQKLERLRRNVNRFNKVITGLQKVGVVFGPMQILTVTGRRCGQPRDVPIAVVPIEGSRYVFQAYPKAAWVANLRANPEATLKRGRRASSVRMVELSVGERRPILRQNVVENPKSVKYLVNTGLVTEPNVDAVVAAADRIAVFRVDPA
jgi:deazaflavin-dependent oxidoreductase (nitroreductase family)